MIVGIHVNYKGSIQPFTQKYLDILNFNKIDAVKMDIQDEDFWQKYEKLDAFIFHIGQSSDILQISGSFLPLLYQYSSIPVYPDMPTSWHYDDKVKQNYLANLLKLEFADSWVFWDKKKALTWIKSCEYPIVFKLKGGAGSTNVILVKNQHQAKNLIVKLFDTGLASSSLHGSWKIKFFPVNRYIRGRMIATKRFLMGEDITPYWATHKNYVYFQKYLPNNRYDTRVIVIGNRAFALRRYNRKGDFRASGSGLLDHDPSKIDMRMIQIALQTSKKCQFQTMAYDFLYDDNKPKISEISYTFPYKFVLNSPGFWDSQLNWHEGHVLPQLCILEDLLKIPLEQPHQFNVE